jgi:hypothetical protein
MLDRLPILVGGFMALCAAPAAALAQQENTILAVGELAPDFELVGATRFGVLRDPVRLRDFHGKTVVLAFFYQARTPG